MSNFTNASLLLAGVLVVVGISLALLIWRASYRVPDPRLRFIALGFALLGLKGLVSIYSIHWDPWHHEFAEMVGHVFDLAIVGSLSAPILLGR